ncbi:MAG: hypothetical protein Q8Q88_19545 [Phenylobacterium sp.]|uniref:sulfotransferase family protein n=1 Tax=Phenylobacterium sp. TaxID=1871053 RepID=UPI002732D425|nr:hypothetical protein [Phenylobacterium sp.]MDP3749236.1 hypothetical protein [Phenylobacterium sp.]
MTKTIIPNVAGARTAYLVLGMHRSGTSAITQLLALAGAQLPENVMPGDEHNAKGYFEPWKIAIFNDQRLRAGGSAWDDVFAFPYSRLTARQERSWVNRATALFEAEFGGATFPLMKDPRVSLLLPLWRTALDELDIAPRCVISVRHPLAVADSLSKRNGFPIEKSVLLWVTYMLAAEAHTRDLPRVFVSYDELLGDWRAQGARIEAAHEAALPRLTRQAGKEIDAFLSTDLRHSPGQGDLAAVPQVGALANAVYDWCMAAARDHRLDGAPLASGTQDLIEMKQRMGAFVSPVTKDLDATRTELLEVRQRQDFERKGRRRLEAEIGRLEAEIARLQAERAAVGSLLDRLLSEG